MINLFNLTIIILSRLSYGQSDQLRVNTNESYIKYEGDHLLHSWEGTNDKVNGLAVLDANSKSLQKLAILLYVRDFDSQNSGRDAHALEVLEALKYPEIKFYSESIKIENENLTNEFFVKIDGNRQIVIHILDEKNVRAQLLDLRFKYPNLVR